jgi:hypothetical protein
MRLQAAEFSFIEKAGERNKSKGWGNTTRKTVLREVEIFHAEPRIFDLYLAISRGRFIWTIINSNKFDLLL